MPRYLSLSNGRLLVNFDRQYYLRDLYWPHVGQENHTEGDPFRFGVFCDGQFSWLADPSWDKQIRYGDDAIVSDVTLRRRDLGLALICRDTVDVHENMYLRCIEAIDERPPSSRDARARSVRLFFAQDLHIYGTRVGDTAYYEPDCRAVVHYKGKRWFLIATAKKQGDQWVHGVDQWSVGQSEATGKEGTWRDAEDGELSGQSTAQGSVDSVVALHLEVPPGGRAAGCYSICAAWDRPSVMAVHQALRENSPDVLVDRTRSYWELWVGRERPEEIDLPAKLATLYRRSLLVIRGHMDRAGGIVAATDYDTARAAHDTYAYVWPRDGALAAAALIRAGYEEAPERFFTFCHSVLTPDGYLLHKFNPDGSLASTWEGWYHRGQKVLPIQEDETALVVWALRLLFERFHDVEFIKPLYRKLVFQAADWMVDYTDDQGLVQPSWSVWEEQRGIYAWTVGTVWAGLQAAARFADDLGQHDSASRYRQAAQRLKEAVAGMMWDTQENRFVRALEIDESGHRSMDKKLDSALAGLWYFGMFDAADPRIRATMDLVRQRLWVQSPVGGIARYENDQYHKVVPEGQQIPGNPWFVCTLWLAQWYIRKARIAADLEPAAALIRWAASRALPNGLMAEQIHPFTDEPLSACPLTWSHSTFVLAVHEYMTKCRELKCSASHLDDEDTDHLLDQEALITNSEGAVL